DSIANRLPALCCTRDKHEFVSTKSEALSLIFAFLVNKNSTGSILWYENKHKHTLKADTSGNTDPVPYLGGRDTCTWLFLRKAQELFPPGRLSVNIHNTPVVPEEGKALHLYVVFHHTIVLQPRCQRTAAE
ncbi:hypothetical protein BaRGS_00032530, partial [Batillaria attramentaria]